MPGMKSFAAAGIILPDITTKTGAKKKRMQSSDDGSTCRSSPREEKVHKKARFLIGFVTGCAGR